QTGTPTGGTFDMVRRLPLDLDPLDDHVLYRAVARSGPGARDRIDDLLRVVVDHFTEDGVLSVEPVRLADRDEELRSVGTGAGVGHRQLVRPVNCRSGWISSLNWYPGPPRPVPVGSPPWIM